MNKYLKYNYYIGRIVYGFILMDIIFRYKYDMKKVVLFSSIFIFAFINDYFRCHYYYKDDKKYYLSLFVSIVMGGILTFFVMGYTDIYMLMILYEIVMFNEGKEFKIFYALSLLTILFVCTFRNIEFRDVFSINFWQENLFDFLMIILGVLFYSFVLNAYKVLNKEKAEVERLNKILKEQSEEIERLTVEKERNRIAQEIHDYLGHTLVALNMNLDVASKYINKDVNKSKDILGKCQELAKDSMASLRKAVYTLKEENLSLGLKEAIKKLIENITYNNEEININFYCFDEIENLSPDYKNIIYKTVTEGLTNSIKHGKASEINISIEKHLDFIETVLEDNGAGCSSITKGNGLIGIEERILSVGGNIEYISEKGKGFKIIMKFRVCPSPS